MIKSERPKRKPWQHGRQVAYEPTAEQIAEAAAEVRATWTEAERLSRRGITTRMVSDSTQWTVPTVHCPDIRDAEEF